ncbi:ABC transporter permease [Nocardioides solisilvae]|uniref:ABC transporter permease n=1 Tax=Nocardioides solisilvae TaxID=1542435 RepID=UPI000D74F9EC|nr:ABC transporter permease [Nocardioides solisilvae]
MNALDLRPSPGAAPLWRQVVAQARMESRLMLRNGEQLLLALVVPVLVLVGGVRAADRFDLGFDRPVIDVLAPGVLALAVMSTSFTSVAIATGFERRYGLIKRLGASPLPRHGLLLGKVGAVLLVQAVQLVVLTGVALTAGWEPDTSRWWAALLCLLLGSAAFTALGLVVAGTLRAEATLAVANLVYLLLMTGGAVLLPASTYGGFGTAAAWLPSGALGEGVRAALLDGRVDASAMLVLVAWTAVGAVTTARTFKWE